MDEMMNDSFFLDDERALIAHHVNMCKCLDEDLHDALFEKYALNHPDEDVHRMAEKAMDAYCRHRDMAVRTLEACAHCDEPVTFEKNPHVEKVKKLYLDVLREQYIDDVLLLSVQERCNRLYAFMQGVDSAISRDEDVKILPYTGEASEEMEQKLMEKLCGKLARLNISTNEMRLVKEGLLERDAGFGGRWIGGRARADLLIEAKCMYVLAHEGKLRQFSHDISMEECVRFVALAQDMNALRRAERAGEIGGEVAALLALLLVGVAAIALAVLVGAELWIAALAAGEGLKATLLVSLAFFYSVFASVMMVGCAEDEQAQEQLGETFAPATSKIASGMKRFGSYVTLVLPQKIKHLFGGAGGGAGGPAPASVRMQEEERPRDLTPDLPPRVTNGGYAS